jgi:hypothetical protein
MRPPQPIVNVLVTRNLSLGKVSIRYSQSVRSGCCGSTTKQEGEEECKKSKKRSRAGSHHHRRRPSAADQFRVWRSDVCLSGCFFCVTLTTNPKL